MRRTRALETFAANQPAFTELLPMTDEKPPFGISDAVARFVDHMHTRHRVTPVVVSADQSEYKDGKWKLSDEYGRPLAYVADDGTVS